MHSNDDVMNEHARKFRKVWHGSGFLDVDMPGSRSDYLRYQYTPHKRLQSQQDFASLLHKASNLHWQGTCELVPTQTAFRNSRTLSSYL